VTGVTVAAAFPPAAFLLVLFALAAAEAAWPLHQAQREGRGRLQTNFGLGLINLAVVALLPVGAVVAAEWARSAGVGLLNQGRAPLPLAAVATVAARSLLVYGLHRLAHAWPLLWRFHRVHHGDTAVDLSTGLRHHPVEALYLTVAAAAVAVAFGLSPEALAVYEVVALALSLFAHANMRLPDALDRALGAALWTPALHHVHHSARRVETDSNYGDVLTVWDRLFGTFRRLPAVEVERLRLGLGDADDAGASSLIAQLARPLRRGRDTASDPAAL